MKTASRRIKGNIEDDVKLTKNLVILQVVGGISIIVIVIIGIAILGNYIASQLGVLGNLQDLFGQMP